MNSEIQSAITKLAEKAGAEQKSDDAMRYAQAALNLAHTAQVLKQVESSK